MSHLCLGWEIEKIREDLSFPTEEVYARPSPTDFDGVVNGWWDDLLSYLKKFDGIDVFACSGYMDFFCDEEVYIIGLRVDFGWVLSNNSYDPDDYNGGSKIEDFQNIVEFILDQRERGYFLPPPKVHISQWLEHDFNYLETLIEICSQQKEKREEIEEKKVSQICDTYGCSNKYTGSWGYCTVCHGNFCFEHLETQGLCTHCNG